MNLNSNPVYPQTEDICPTCGDICIIASDLDTIGKCNNCRSKGNINIVLAMSENLTIGKDNELPWNLPADLRMFKELTSCSILLMGRRCYESIGRPLPNRENVVLSRDSSLEIPGCIVINTISEFMSRYKNDPRDIFIIGGANLYEQTFNIADTLYLTLVQGDIDGDVKIKGLDMSRWEQVGHSQTFHENNHNFCFMKFKGL